MQADAESRISAPALRDRGLYGSTGSPTHPSEVMHSEDQVDTRPPKSEPSQAPTMPEPPQITTFSVDSEPDLQLGDYGTLPGENIWETFEDRRKKLGFPRWQWGAKLKEGGSTSVGEKIERGEVTPRQAKSLGFSNTDEVYHAADAFLRSQGA